MTSEKIDALNAREKECLRLVPRLYTSKAIALELGVRPDTIDRYIGNAKAKLGTSSRYEAAEVLRASESGAGGPIIGASGFSDIVQMPDPVPTLVAPEEQSPGALHEERSRYIAGPRRSGFRGLLRNASWRNEKGIYDASILRRLALIWLYALITIAGFAIFTVALLVWAAASRELHLH